uniref:Transient receptor potential cation channel subfamily M member 8-like n=1 Tax=Crassostrea virginica TaxID=6565 RepID=A0A8B8CBR2_CRAVI|nr:transient receptor potential cation channel subfamily M member 8-like [Crassostrea virginica]
MACSETISNSKDAWEKFTHEVKNTPTMVFSVIGDSDSFVPRPWPRTVFQTALIEAAKSGGETWILYGGCQQDVSKAVKDAYLKYGNRQFGTKNPKRLKDDKNRHIKLISITDTQREENPFETVVQCTLKNQDLDSFLLDFEKFVSDQELRISYFSQRTSFKVPTPIAIIVCEGGLQTVAHTAEALQHRLPVIIMKGSGKAADLILVYLEKSDQLRKEAEIHFGRSLEDEEFYELKNDLDIILEKKDLMGVFDLNSDDPLKLSSIVEEIVVRSLSKEKSLTTDEKEKPTQRETVNVEFHEDRQGMTDYSMTINRFWKNSIKLERYERQPAQPTFTSSTSHPIYFSFGFQLLQELSKWKECGHFLLLEALKKNRCDYVRLLLRKGVKLYQENLPELYAQTVSCATSECKVDGCFHMQGILKHVSRREVETLCDTYNKTMKEVQNNKNSRRIDNLKSDPGRSVAASAKELCCKILQYKAIKIEEEDSSDMFDILLWAIFANRKEIAEICWLHGKDHILSGLVCSVLLHNLSKKALHANEHSLSTDLEEHAKLFEQRCIRIMDEMYKESKRQAAKTMDDDAVIWGVETNPLRFAYVNCMYEIVAHICSRHNLNIKWYNKLPQDSFSFLKSAVGKKGQFFKAPKTKYILNYILFFTVLVMYSSFVLTSLHIEQGIEKGFEFFVYLWAFGDYYEQYISFEIRRSENHKKRITGYLYDFWNVVDLLSCITLMIAVCVRYFRQSENHTIARRMFSVSLLIMYIRFLEVFLINQKLGTTLIMIKEMLKDLLGFLLIALFVVLGVGCYYHANQFPDYQNFWSGNWTEWRIWYLLYYPYWQIYAEINLDFLQAEESSSLESGNIPPQKDWSVVAVAAVYLLFAHLLLVNLLIATFSNTFERVQKNSEKFWWYEQYALINFYQWHIPSPFNLIHIPYRLYEIIKRRCYYQQKKIGCNDGKTKDGQYMTQKEYRRELQRILAAFTTKSNL